MTRRVGSGSAPDGWTSPFGPRASWSSPSPSPSSSWCSAPRSGSPTSTIRLKTSRAIPARSSSAATTLDNSLLSAQAGLEGYLLTGDTTFLSSYSRADHVVPTQLGQLEALTLGSPAGETWGPVIQHDANRLILALDRLEVQPPSPTPSTTVRSLLQTVRSETASIRADISSLTGDETAIIDGQQSSIHTSNIFLPAIAIAAVVLAVAGGVMVSQLFTSGVVTRLRRLERATEAVESGATEAVEVPSGRDEIGRLSARLLDTTAQLRERAEERDRARGELENILTASPVVSLRYDVGTRRFSYASPNIDRLLGMSADQAMAEPRGRLRALPSELGRPTARRAGGDRRARRWARRDPDALPPRADI